MLSTPTLGEDRVTTAHRARLAFIYVRQSTLSQVRQHQESTALQYRLVDRAVLLGWPRERVEVIDEDLGRSGATGDGRHGFQRLIAEIGLGKAGESMQFRGGDHAAAGRAAPSFAGRKPG